MTNFENIKKRIPEMTPGQFCEFFFNYEGFCRQMCPDGVDDENCIGDCTECFKRWAAKEYRESEKNGWISVKEQLPELNEDGYSRNCLISIVYTSESGKALPAVTQLGYYWHDQWFMAMPNAIAMSEKEGFRVTYWMALPEAPLSEGKI